MMTTTQQKTMNTTTDTDRRLLYALTERTDRTAGEIRDRLNWTKTKLDQVASAARAEGWLAVFQGGNSTGHRYKALSRPACCTGGYVPPAPEDRVPRHVFKARMADEQRRQRRERMMRQMGVA